jgi:transcriptional regulator with XRE-family HTH domain
VNPVRTPTRAEPAIAEPHDGASSLGPRLRAVRLRRGLGLRELARRLDLSPSAISRYETGKMQPSVRTLYAFASELQVTVDELLFERARTPDELVLQRADDSPGITLESGVTWKRLMFWSDEEVEFMETTYEPGGASCPDESLVRHDGHEFGHVLSGTLRVVVGFDELLLGPGDSVAFPSTTPHRLSNDSGETVRAIWVVRGRRRPQVST